MELPETLVYCSGRMTDTGRVTIGSWSKVLGGIACLLSGEAFPHHSFATHYDTSNMVEINGMISDVQMRSPHSFFEVDVVAPGGTTETWEVEAHALPILRRLGMTSDTIRVGDEVTIRGPRSRRPEKLLLFGAEIITSSGQQFEMLNSIRRKPDYATADTREGVTGIDRLTGKWMTFISGQTVSDSPLPLNDAARSARESFDVRENAASECIPPNLPSILMIPYAYVITRDAGSISIFHEYAQVRRSVAVGSDELNVTDPAFGRRLGRYEDDTLIVESTGFPALSAGLASGWDLNGNGFNPRGYPFQHAKRTGRALLGKRRRLGTDAQDIPSSTQKELVERYSVNEDGSELTLRYTVSDPAYLTEPYSAEIVWHRMPDDSPTYDFNCDAGIALRSTQNAAVSEE